MVFGCSFFVSGPNGRRDIKQLGRDRLNKLKISNPTKPKLISESEKIEEIASKHTNLSAA